MKIIKLDSAIDKIKILQQVGSTKAGIDIMQEKMELNLFFIKDLKTPAANILKQEALTIGAELAVDRDTITCKEKMIDALLIADNKRLKILSKKLKIQPFGLKELADRLEEFTHAISYKTVKVMGVLNANDDSFYKDSRFSNIDAIEKIEGMIEDGVDIIDIGAVSSRPGSSKVSVFEEMFRIKPIIQTVFQQKFYERVKFSLDSYEPEVIEFALNHGFTIVNDITGLANDKVAKLVSAYGATAVIMHMQNSPKDMQINPMYDNVLIDIEEFFIHRIEKAKSFGIKDIVIDVGIGFGKRLEDNLMLIKHLSHFGRFNLPILIGASRKSMIDMIVPTPIEDRLPGTLTLHLKAVEEGASIIRCHDVKEHVSALKVYEALKRTTV